MLVQTASRPSSVPRLQCPAQPYPSTYWMVQRLTSRRLASSRRLTPFDCSACMYSRCCSVRLGRRPGKRPSVRAFAWPATERSLIEFRHHSLKASTMASWSLPVAVDVLKSSDSGRNSTPARSRPSITCSPQVRLVSGRRLSGLCGRKIADCDYMAVESCQPAREVTPEECGLRTRFW